MLNFDFDETFRLTRLIFFDFAMHRYCTMFSRHYIYLRFSFLPVLGARSPNIQILDGLLERYGSWLEFTYRDVALSTLRSGYMYIGQSDELEVDP